MTGRQRIAAALRGDQPDRVPVMLHNFLMAAREAGFTQRRFREDPEAVAASFVQAVETYGYDGVLVDVDTVTLAEALGARVDHPEDHPARWAGPSIGSLGEAARLDPGSIARHPRLETWLESVRLLKARLGDEIFIRGNCDQAAFSLAGMLRGPAEWMMDLLDPKNEEAAHVLLDIAARAASGFIGRMAEAGADMVSNGDSPAGPDLISPAMYRRFAWPYERRLAERAHDLGLPYALHICGNTDLILEDMVKTGADAFELDQKTDARFARSALFGRAVFIGNIDPSGILALGTPDRVASAVRDLLSVFAGEPRFILNAGCAIPAETPSTNLRAMIAAAREFMPAG